MREKLCILTAFILLLSSCTDEIIDNPIDKPVNNVRQIYSVFVETAEASTITKEKNLDGRIVIKDSSGIILEDAIKIKGRGNSTWGYDKKPYQVKFSTKRDVFGMPKEKTYILLANYLDTTLIRNDVALFMGRSMSILEWTPSYEYVDLYLNGEYRGIYQFGEKLLASKNRVNVGDDGFLLEIDKKAKDSDVTFSVSHLENPVNIKDPDLEKGDDSYNYILNYVNKADSVLYSDSFLDPETGYKKYFDIKSFAEWYVINEITKNCDSRFRTSCYMNLKRGGQLKMGPLWDFDLAFGNYPFAYEKSVISNDPENYYLKDVQWFGRMFQDSEFIEKVKERFSYYYDNRQTIYDRMESDYLFLVDKVYRDNVLWGRITDIDASEEMVRNQYRYRIDYMKNWLEKRFQWLNDAFKNIDIDALGTASCPK